MDISQAIALFMEEEASAGLAPRSLNNERLFINRLGVVCEQLRRERGKRSPFQVTDLDSTAIARYFATSSETRNGNRNNMLVVLRKFIRWCELNRHLGAGEGMRLLATRKHKREERLPKYYVPVEDFPRLLDASTRHPADRMTMALALYTLCRSGEISNLRLKDINVTRGTMQVWRQKRRRWTEVAICPELLDELTGYLDWLGGELGYGSWFNLQAKQPEWRVIPRLQPVRSRRPEGQILPATRYHMDPVSPQRHLERVVKRALEKTGAMTVDGKHVKHYGEGLHTIRRSGARAMLDHLSMQMGNDKALLQVCVMLDHESTTTTLIYIGMNKEREQLNDWLKNNSPYGSGKFKQAARHLRAV